MSASRKTSLFQHAWFPIIAVVTVFSELGQVAAQPPSQPLDRREAHGQMLLIDEATAIDGQQNAEQSLVGFHDTLRVADELAAALATAKEKFDALTGATKIAASGLYLRLEATRRQRDRLSATLVDVQSKLRMRESREKQLTERVAALDEEARQSESEIVGLRLQLEASEQRGQQLEEVGEEVAELKDELLGLRRVVKTANVALARAQAERDAARAETEALRAEVAALLNTALASLQKEHQPFEAPVASSPEAQDRREGL
jgi:chromosome segregation ATPase